MTIKRFALAAILASAVAAAFAAPTDSIVSKPQKPLQTVTAGVAAIAVNAGLTEALKHSVREWRPNLENDRAFPSRHTSWAFAASTFLSNTFYRRAPWVPLASQALASGLGLQRLHCGAHFGGDVAAGMVLGAGSAVAGQAIADLIFGRKMKIEGAEALLRPALEVRSGVMLPFKRSDGWRSGYFTAVKGSLPFAAHWSATLSAGAFAVSRVNGGHTGYVKALEGISLAVGASYFLPLTRSLALRAGAGAGGAFVRRWSSRWAAAASASAGLHWQLTPRFAAAIDCGCNYLSAPSLTSVTVAASSVYCF